MLTMTSAYPAMSQRGFAKHSIQEGMRNDSRVYEVLRQSGRPMTIAELNKAVPDVVEKTVRRAIAGLLKSGHVIEAGRYENAKLYAAKGATTGESGGKLIPLGQESLTVLNFVQLFAGMDQNPFGTRLKTDPLSEKFMQVIRQRMLFVVISAGEPGFNQQVESVHESLGKAVSELRRLTEMMEAFVNSPVWFEHYRDAIALAVREVQKEDPELYQLAMDFVRSGA